MQEKNISHSTNQTRTKQPNSRHCFVCGLDNPFGLRLTFYETMPGEVVVETIIPDHFQGYPGVVHGGIVASILDEALGRVHMGEDPENSRFLYTAKLSVHYRKPVPTNTPIRIVGQAVKSKKRTATSIAKIYDQDGQLLVDADAVLINVPEENLKEVDLENLGWKIYAD
jgi:uncharacterized protein (TIGR00369 family)